MVVIAATATKPSQDSEVGITIRKINGSMRIHEIDDKGIFAETALKVGMDVVSINSAQCTEMSDEDVVILLKQAEGTIVVVAEVGKEEVDIVVPPSAPFVPEVMTHPTTTPTEATPNEATDNTPLVVEALPVIESDAITEGGSNKPPSGVEAGGMWGEVSYFGSKTTACAIGLAFITPPLWWLICFCPFDKRDGYRVHGKVSQRETSILD